jgi:thiol-disulfide isomerase/thioredoxin
MTLMVKRVALTLSLLSVFLMTACGSSTPQAVSKIQGQVVSCASIAHNPAIAKGTSVPCIDGGAGQILESLKGPVVVNVWGSWCAPCMEEIPHFVDLAQTKKIAIVGVDVEEPNMKVGRAFILSHGMTWPILFDPDGRTKALYGMGVPVTWFINAQGVVTYRHVGIITSDAILYSEVTKYLGISI